MSGQLATCWVSGVGLWLPGFASAEAWLTGVADPEVTRPPAAVLPSRQRRRTTLLTRALCDVYQQAVEAAQVPPAAPSIFGSAYGETQTMITLLGMRHTDDGALSPTKFAGSVHNCASGNVTIATGYRGFTTSLAAGRDTPAMALLEASLWLADRGGAVVLALGDVGPPEVLVEPARQFETLAVGLVLSADRPVSPLARLSAPRPTATAPPRRRALAPERLRNPCAGALELADTILRGGVGAVSLDPETPGVSTGRWAIDVLGPEERS